MFFSQKQRINDIKHMGLDPTTFLLTKQNNLLDRKEKKLFKASKKFLSKYHKSKSQRIKVKPIKHPRLPAEIKLKPIPKSTNDFTHLITRNKTIDPDGLSVIIPTYNRSKLLEITLASLSIQKTKFDFEVIVADDGSSEDIGKVVEKFSQKLDISHCWQPDEGYKLCAARNMGIKKAKYGFVAILDCDMAPCKNWIESYMQIFRVTDQIALIGPRRYIDTTFTNIHDILNNKEDLESYPDIVTNNDISGERQGNISLDWRLEVFDNTENLKLDNTPFRYFSGGNVALCKSWIAKAGFFDEEFKSWGGEDNEFGYRLYRAGCYFMAVQGAMAFHQEPPGGENETNRFEGKSKTNELLFQKTPYHYRKLKKSKIELYEKPLVSIYVPAHNCENHIEECVDSALNQTITDLEVCICNDGSTDNTEKILVKRYGNNPRVKLISQDNKGIASASNAAVSLANGYYIGQLDSDDYLEPDAVELVLREFLRNKNLICVYSANRNVDANGRTIKPGYNFPEYSRAKFMETMICHHFRMFTMRAWNQVDGFNESYYNAVDYDFYLRLSEIGEFKHINFISYNRRIHGKNTSVVAAAAQKENHFKILNAALDRNGINDIRYAPFDEQINSRKYKLINI